MSVLPPAGDSDSFVIGGVASFVKNMLVDGLRPKFKLT